LPQTIWMIASLRKGLTMSNVLTMLGWMKLYKWLTKCHSG